jgi:5-methylcytosine-specific restriction endonuclease McrA
VVSMDVLVLSSTYEPINQVTWTRAMTLLLGDHSGKMSKRGLTRTGSALVEVVEEYTDWNVRSARKVYKVPAVIRFLDDAFHVKRSVRFSRENVYARDKGRCQYCAVNVKKNEFTYDHVIPRAQGGRTRWENVVVSCLPCNQKKGNRTPAQAGLRLLVKPEKPRSLPGQQRLALPRKVPEAWKPYLRDFAYWHGELESD